jgi:protein-disulfide isomerase
MTRSTSDRPTGRRGMRALGAALVAIALLAGTAACSLGGSSSVPTATAKAPTGVQGAVNFDKGYLQSGTGSKKVDIWFDPMCPVCGVFEQTNGDKITEAVADGSITLRLHPLTFLDRLSNGTGYSTRAVAALTCVGVNDPDGVVGFYQGLYEDQPEENSDGLTNKELAKRATDQGLADISDCLADSGPYQAWAQANTARSQAGPVAVPGFSSVTIKGTPTVLVNGRQYSGSVDDAQAFSDFFAKN